MEEQIAELLTKVESLQLRVIALEDGILNLVGFYREDSDGSTQGRVKFGQPKTQIEPVAATPTEETGTA